MPEAVVKTALFERSLRAVEARLAEDGLRLADGMECSVVGRLTTNPAFGELRLVALHVEPGAAVGAVASARDELLRG